MTKSNDQPDFCVLYIDDRFQADCASRKAFVESGIPGTIVPAETGCGVPELVCGSHVIRGNSNIRRFLSSHRG